MNAAGALSSIPAGLRDPLLEEYRSITQNYFEHRWSPSELSGGKFCEVVYTILDGHAKSAYANSPQKPRDFPSACRALESNSGVPRSFQILIPRALPALYEVRNNRGVGHAGGDVDPNNMDATLVMSVCNWIMAELVRCFHNVPIAEAQSLVDTIAERRIPIVWEGVGTKRVLDTKLTLSEQILFLAGTSVVPVKVDILISWADYENKAYFRKLLADLHKKRLIEFSITVDTVLLLPPGANLVAKISRARH